MGITIASERDSFSRRLRQALHNATHTPDSPTQLARNFNIRFPGPSITAHAARKWLVGEAIPTQDKLRTLADWLHVPIDWLRFGTENGQTEATLRNAASFEAVDLQLITDLQQLNEQHRYLAHEFIRIMIQTNRQNQGSSTLSD